MAKRRAKQQRGRSNSPQRRAQHAPAAQPNSTDPSTIVQQTVQSMTITSAWQGPVPPPEALEHYERVEAGLATRIIHMSERAVDMAERQMDHRIDMEGRMVRGMNARANHGLWIAAVLAILVLAGSFGVILAGHDVAGATIASIDLVGLCSVFIYGRYDQNRRENERTQNG